MQFIFLHYEEKNYTIVTADTALDALKRYIEQNYFCDAGMKVFAILCESSKMDLAELIAYANTHFLCSYNAIKAIYSLGDKIFEETNKEE